MIAHLHLTLPPGTSMLLLEETLAHAVAVFNGKLDRIEWSVPRGSRHDPVALLAALSALVRAFDDVYGGEPISHSLNHALEQARSVGGVQ